MILLILLFPIFHLPSTDFPPIFPSKWSQDPQIGPLGALLAHHGWPCSPPWADFWSPQTRLNPLWEPLGTNFSPQWPPRPIPRGISTKNQRNLGQKHFKFPTNLDFILSISHPLSPQSPHHPSVQIGPGGMREAFE